MKINIIEMDDGKKIGMNDVKRNFLLNFDIEEDKKGNPVSLILTAEEQGEAEWFCVTFFEALSRKRAGFNTIDGGKGIKFFNEECPFQPAEVIFTLDEKKRNKLQKFLEVKKLAIMDMRPEKIGIQIFQHKK